MLLALLIGFFSSLHCLGMCGGIVGAMTMSLPVSIRQNPKKLLAYSLAYNAGRIGSYTLAGLLAGFLGQSVITLLPLWAGQGLRILFSLLLILIGLSMSGFFPQLSYIEKTGQSLWCSLQPLLTKVYPPGTYMRALLAGMLWGWLPCSLVYYCLGIAVTLANPLDAALFMLAFGGGNLLTLLSASFLFGKLAFIKHARELKLLAALVLVVWGIFSLLTLIHPSLIPK